MAAAAAPARFDGMSSKQLVRLWEEVIDRDVVAAREVFFRALLRDAAAEDALCRLDATAEHKQDEVVARPAAAAGADGGGAGEDRGHPPPRERLSSAPCREASPPLEPTPTAPMVVLCLRAATAPPLQASRRRGASDHAR
uniref:Uncharacterized protein n=1 Tax=Oryza barthii TaxID=65489 RepID=A0A0D3FJB9_9ORYZ